MASWPEFDSDALLSALIEGGVEFVVVGGIAAIAHGTTRLTQDLDVWPNPDRRNLDRLGQVLVALKARLRGVPDDAPFVPDGRTLRRTTILCLETSEGPLDVLSEPSGAPSYAIVRRRAVELDFAGHQLAVAGLDDLLAMKRAANRPKDRDDIAELETIRRLTSGP